MGNFYLSKMFREDTKQGEALSETDRLMKEIDKVKIE
jgi:hypothetical protein